ncbi:MAG: FAD-dependent oxidoreductase [Candidatus Niyogibacteria bacterium]|nr:FAD-dependent oxidoreductase [Candidatus Niyogibacteria bacterium]
MVFKLMIQNILILGGGFGGVRVALDLAKHLPRNAKITLINRAPYHSYTPDYHRIASAFLPEGRKPDPKKFLSLAYTVAIPLKMIFKKYRHVEIVVEEVTDIFFNENKVEVGSGRGFSYDWLVMALGSKSDYCGMQGIEGRVYAVKKVEEALNVRNAVDELFAHKAKHERIKLAIIGGGFLGCEMAGGLVDFAKKLSALHGRPRSSFEIIILEAGDRILAGVSSWASATAAERLKKLGVKIKTASVVTEMSDKEIIFKNGEHVSYDLAVWTAGVCANSIAANLPGVKLENKERLDTDKYLRLPTGQAGLSSHKNVFVIGDMAHFQGDGMERSLEMTAQAAIHEGRYVAYTLRRTMFGRRLFPYVPCVNKFLIDLGGRYAIFDSKYVKISGLVAWLMKRAVPFMYMSDILPWRAAFALWRRGIKIF